jgi:outer membrane protein assembly factor BamA
MKEDGGRMKLNLTALVQLATLGVAAVATAQDGGPSEITTGASYSSQRGALAFIALDGRDIKGTGIDLHFAYEAGKSDLSAEAFVAKTWQLGQTRLGQDSAISLRLGAERSELDAQPFKLDSRSIELSFGASASPDLRYGVTLFHMRDDLEATGPDVSPLIISENGKTTATGLSFDLSYSTLEPGPLPQSGFRIGSNVAASLAGDREWVAVSVNGAYAQPVGSAVLAVRAEAGVIEGRNGKTVGILDRAFLGGDMPRGFAYAGIGPRDAVADTVNAALGGNQYFSTSIEVRTPLPVQNLTVGAFVDAGSVWDLDVTAGGASGDIDDAFNLRTSAGVSIYWQTGIGLVQANIAKPIKKTDLDEEEVFSIGLNASF